MPTKSESYCKQINLNTMPHTKKKIAQSSAETSFSITFPTETKADHNNMKDPKHWSTQLGKRTSAHQSQQVSNGTHTLKKQTLRNNMALGI